MAMLHKVFNNASISSGQRCCHIPFKLLRATFSQVPVEDEEFKGLDLKSTKSQHVVRKKLNKMQPLPPRSLEMPIDQDWSNVWPGPRSFHPAVVPLPLRQGYVEKGHIPGKYANAELMKIPNFLHLTPPAIKKQCQALKQFCTPWPDGLETDSKCEKHFPLEVISSDYCHSSPTIRDHNARIVTIKVKLRNFHLDHHAKDKLLRLVGPRYNPQTDVLTLLADRCPLKKQNYDYTMYLLTALIHECKKVEEWESEKTEADMEHYVWDNNVSRTNILNVLSWPDPSDSSKDSSSIPHIQEYKEAVTNLWNEGESEYTLSKYKIVTKKLLNLPENQLVPE